ncbi:MAG: HAD family hydrolase [Pseudomonadales bacterium]|jgi:putative hydrolase of the HAD superfamily
MEIRGLLFDLGGTLFSYQRRGGMGRALQEVVSGLGLEVEPREIGRAWGEANEASMRRFAEQDYFLHRDLFHETLLAFATRFGRPVSDDLAERFQAAQRQSVIDHLPLRAECHEALEALKSRGLYLAIVSNIDDDYLHPLVEKHELDRWLDHWTSSEEARSCKPHTGIYRYALSKAGLGVEETLFVGDSLHHDVAGASAVGMRSARIVEEGVSTPLTGGLAVTAEPDYQITALTELVDIVDAVNERDG